MTHGGVNEESFAFSQNWPWPRMRAVSQSTSKAPGEPAAHDMSNFLGESVQRNNRVTVVPPALAAMAPPLGEPHLLQSAQVGCILANIRAYMTAYHARHASSEEARRVPAVPSAALALANYVSSTALSSNAFRVQTPRGALEVETLTPNGIAVRAATWNPDGHGPTVHLLSPVPVPRQHRAPSPTVQPLSFSKYLEVRGSKSTPDDIPRFPDRSDIIAVDESDSKRAGAHLFKEERSTAQIQQNQGVALKPCTSNWFSVGL